MVAPCCLKVDLNNYIIEPFVNISIVDIFHGGHRGSHAIAIAVME